MPEVRMLLSLRSHESRMRRRVALCDELCSSIEALYRAARALSISRLGIGEIDVHQCIRKAPASTHTICSMIRDFAAAVNQIIDLTGADTGALAELSDASADSPLVPIVRDALFRALGEHTGLRSWKDVAWIGIECDARRRITFRWSVGMECVQKNPQRAYPALRPVVLLARRIADEALALLDPLTGPIAAERAAAYSITTKLRAQIDHIRSVVNQKCDALEDEMRSVQSAIVKAQSQTMSLVKNLANIGRTN